MKRGALTLVFDDGYTHILHDIVPLLEQHHVRGVFAISLDHTAIEKTEHRPVSPWSEWLPIRQQGHELAAHSVSHVNLTTLNDTQLNHELQESQEKINATTLIYPGGAYDARVCQVAQRYYHAARTVERGFEKNPPSDPFRLHTFNFTRRNFSVTRANALAVWAWLTNSWFIETYHIVDDVEKVAIHSVSRTAFTQHLRFISRLPLRVDTIQGILNTTSAKNTDTTK